MAILAAKRGSKLGDIDAPELKQPHGEQSRAVLTARILNHPVTVT